jgi:hypothetical protein
MLAGYLVVMAVLGFGVRRLIHPAADRPQEPARAPEHPTAPAAARRGRLALARRVVGTVVGGYALLMAVVIVYYYGVASVGGGFIVSALSGTALLIAVALPLFAAATWLSEHRRHRGERAAARRR